MKATIKDVARRAGVSTATVSRMLNHTGTVSPETTERIREAIEALDFQLNSRAQNFKTGRTNAIAVVIPDISNPFFASVIHEIEAVLSPRNYTLMIASTNESREREAQILQFIAKGSADGVILASTFHDYKDLKPSMPGDIPVVFFDRRLKDCPCDMITESDSSAIRHSVQYMIRCGHKKIGCIAGLSHLSTTVSRVSAYQNAMADSRISLEDRWICYASSVSDNGYEYAKQLLGAGCTALLVVSNTLTRGCLSYLLERGIVPGKDVLVAGYHNPDFLNIDMIRMEMPYKDLGRKAGECILSRIQDPKLPSRVIELTVPVL